MLRIARNILGLIGALVLMAILGGAAFVLGRSNPNIPVGVFFGAGGIIYTLVILAVLNR